MKVFVYGTLKEGFVNNTVLRVRGAKFVGNTSIKGTMYSLTSFPVVDLEGEDSVKGELYEISKECEKNLDFLEGYPKLYNKSEVVTKEGVTALVYHMDFNKIDLYGGTKIKTGEWF